MSRTSLELPFWDAVEKEHLLELLINLLAFTQAHGARLYAH